MHIFYEPVRGLGFFFVAARNINIFGHSFILERERGKRVVHDGFNKVFQQAFEYDLSQGQDSCSFFVREFARVLVRACRRRKKTSKLLLTHPATSILQEAPKKEASLS